MTSSASKKAERPAWASPPVPPFALAQLGRHLSLLPMALPEPENWLDDEDEIPESEDADNVE